MVRRAGAPVAMSPRSCGNARRDRHGWRSAARELGWVDTPTLTGVLLRSMGDDLVFGVGLRVRPLGWGSARGLHGSDRVGGRFNHGLPRRCHVWRTSEYLGAETAAIKRRLSDIAASMLRGGLWLFYQGAGVTQRFSNVPALGAPWNAPSYGGTVRVDRC
jgi:hypothetical protein